MVWHYEEVEGSSYFEELTRNSMSIERRHLSVRTCSQLVGSGDLCKPRDGIDININPIRKIKR